MKKIYLNDINNQIIVDTRSQHEFQAGHLENALNLNFGNLEKYGKTFLTKEQPIIFVIEDEEKVQNLTVIVNNLDLKKAEGYILTNDLPIETLVTSETIHVEDFLKVKEDYILLDVRTSDEITRPAPKKNLVNVPLDELFSQYNQFDENTEIFTLCGSGNRGTSAASFLNSQGYKATIITGGMKAMQEFKDSIKIHYKEQPYENS